MNLTLKQKKQFIKKNHKHFIETQQFNHVQSHLSENSIHFIVNVKNVR